MNKNTMIITAGVAVVILSVAFVLYAPKNKNSAPSTSKQQVADAPVPRMSPPQESDTTTFNCKGGKSFTIKYLFNKTTGHTLTLSDSNGKRVVPFETPTPIGPKATIKSTDGNTTLVINFPKISVEEKGVTTFTECKFAAK